MFVLTEVYGNYIVLCWINSMQYLGYEISQCICAAIDMNL